MTRRDNLRAWIFALGYTIYATGVIAASALLATLIGPTWVVWVEGVVGLVLALAPIVAWSFHGLED